MNSFEERILALERELRDIKTAHERGLGIVSFIWQGQQAAGGSMNYWKLTATGSNSRIFPFFAQLAVSDVTMHKLSTEPVEVDRETNTITWHFMPVDAAHGGSPEIAVISTDSLTLETAYEQPIN